MDRLDLLAVQGTLKSLFQHHSSKASILWCSALFIVQLSHPYMTTGKTKALRCCTKSLIHSSFKEGDISEFLDEWFLTSACRTVTWLQIPAAGPNPSVSNSIGLGWNQSICISNRFPRNVDAAGPWTTHWMSLSFPRALIFAFPHLAL